MLDLVTEAGSGKRQHRSRLQDLVKRTGGPVRIASAYVTDTGLLTGVGSGSVRLLTSLSAMDVITGASSLKSLRSLVERGVLCCYLTGAPRLFWRALGENISRFETQFGPIQETPPSVPAGTIGLVQ
jgi:hypothetical protein